MANTLEKISKKGAKEFYQGSTTIDIVKSLNELGGLHTLEDFEKQKTIKDNTINCKYKDFIIHQCPPNGPGITVLLMMQMMEKLKIENYKKMLSNFPKNIDLTVHFSGFVEPTMNPKIVDIL